jgi:hypothetical protein
MLTFEMSKQYKGTGISNGLDRGLLVYQNGNLLLDEGMGMGAVAVQSAGMNYFATIQNINNSTNRIEVALTVDKMMQRTIYGIPSKPLTRFIERTCTNMYKERERSQSFWFGIGELINFLLQIKVEYVPVTSIGAFNVTYEILKDEIRVNIRGSLSGNAGKIYIMNELSGRLFCNGIKAGKITPPPHGWQKVTKESHLYSEERGLTFATKEISTSDNILSNLYWGREADKDHCWAGFIFELQTKSREYNQFAYSIEFQEGG